MSGRVPSRLDAPVTATSRVRSRQHASGRTAARAVSVSKSTQRTVTPSGVGGPHPGPDVGVVVEPGHHDLVAGLPGLGQGAGQVEGQLGHRAAEDHAAGVAAEQVGHRGAGPDHDVLGAPLGGGHRPAVGEPAGHRGRDRVRDLAGHLRAAGAVEVGGPVAQGREAGAHALDVVVHAAIEPGPGDRDRPGDRACRDHSTRQQRLPGVERGDVLDDAAGERLGGEPDALEDHAALGVVEELLRDAVQPHRRVDPRVVEGLQQHRAAAADDAVVLDADHQPVLAGQVDERRVDRLDPARVDDGDADALGDQPLGDLDARSTAIEPTADDQHVLGAVCGPARRTPPARPTASTSPLRRTLREAHDGRGVVDLRRPRAAARAAGRASRGAAQPQARARPGGSTCPTCRCGWRRRRR